MEVTITINKLNVYDEVAKTSGYTGEMKQGDETAYERIFATDDDRLMLERFWLEACAMVTDQLKPFVTQVSTLQESQSVDLSANYTVSLALSTSFESKLSNSIRTSLYDFFVSYIVSKWFRITNREEAESYAVDSAAMLESAMRKVYFKRKPRRTVPTT